MSGHDSPPPSPRAAQLHTAAQLTAAKLPRRYLAVLLTVVALVLIDQAVLQPLLTRLTLHGPTINLAGRQRMLSQKISKSALAIQVSSSFNQQQFRQAELKLALAQWTQAHRGLLDGDASLELPETAWPEIRAAFSQLEPSFLAMQTAAKNIAALDLSDHRRHAANAGSDSRLADSVATILVQEPAYLARMEQIVEQYEHQAWSQVRTLRLLSWSAALGIVCSLAALGYLVLRPAHRTIRQQVDHLEERVQERTEELTLANQALQSEMQVRRSAEDRSRQLSTQLAHAARVTALGQLATGLAHELNQPLAAITNYAEACGLLLEMPAPNVAQARLHLEALSQSALRAGGIIRRMRNFVRPGKTTSERLNVNTLVEEVLNLCRHETTHAQVQVQVNLDPQLPLVTGDAIQIQQVLLNLIQNAVQALQESESSPRIITIHTFAAANQARIEVADNGPGWGEFEPDRAFSPFFTTKAQGLGMGLAISRAIIDDHGGRLWGRSQPQQGATISFTLPCEAILNADAQPQTDYACR